jgi:CheY-like chemotaxis protein
VIDDDQAVTMTLEPYFKEQGYKLITAKSAQDGINEAMTRLPSLILLSTTLPDRSGPEVFHELRSRARTANIPVMFLATYTDAKRQNELLSAGADDFINKPFDVDILGLRIRNAIQRQEREGITNPRTGLPTGRILQERVRSLADEYGWYKIDLSIANFDGFREQYGFMTSEEVLAFAAGLLNEVVQSAGTSDDFVGQRDDTEFVIITTLKNGPQVRDLLEKRFNEEVLSFYSFMERDQGFVQVPDGNGGTTQKPLMAAKIKVQEGEPEED